MRPAVKSFRGRSRFRTDPENFDYLFREVAFCKLLSWKMPRTVALCRWVKVEGLMTYPRTSRFSYLIQLHESTSLIQRPSLLTLLKPDYGNNPNPFTVYRWV